MFDSSAVAEAVGGGINWTQLGLGLISLLGTLATLFLSRRTRRDARAVRADRNFVANSLPPGMAGTFGESAPPTPRDPSVKRHRER